MNNKYISETYNFTNIFILFNTKFVIMYDFIYSFPKNIIYLKHSNMNKTYNYNIVYNYIHN